MLFVVPSHQYRKIVTGRGGQEDHSPAKSNASSKSKGSTPKKINKTSRESNQQRDSNKKTKSEVNKAPAKPKSLEQAFKNLTADEFASHLEQLKLIYPGSKLAWLKEVFIAINV